MIGFVNWPCWRNWCNDLVDGMQAISGGGRLTANPLTVVAICPAHGPVVQSALTELLRSYQ